MANLITAEALGDREFIQLSNGSTSVLLSTLLLAGSDLAEKNQNVFGIGMVGFDLGDIGWERESFDEEKAFVLRAIDLSVFENAHGCLICRDEPIG